MGKRSSGFERSPKDFYRTPPEAISPLLPHLPVGVDFAEPCAGDGALIDILERSGHRCTWASDIEPRREDIGELDALDLPKIGPRNVRASCVITNPPWSRDVLHPLIDALSAFLPCWFLFDADWPHTRQSADLIRRCARIVPVGRLKWFPGSASAGKDNCCWYEFLPGHVAGPQFVPRQDAVSRPSAPRPCVDEKAMEGLPDATALLARLRKRVGRQTGIPNPVDIVKKAEAAE